MTHDRPSDAALQSNYLDLFYGVLFHPVYTFRTVAGVSDEPSQSGNRLLFYALLSVLLISTLAPVIHIATTGGNPSNLAVGIPFSAIVGVLIWGVMGLLVALLSYAFTGQMRIRTFLILSGLATLPWIFMGPVSLLKIGLGMAGVVLCAMFGLIIWLWTTLLFALALISTYDMTAERVMIVLIMPFVMVLVSMGWVVGFINNIAHLTPP